LEDYFEKILEFDKMEHIINIFGKLDENVKYIEDTFKTNIVFRGQEIKVTGEEDGVEKSFEVLIRLRAMAEKGEEITKQSVNYIVQLALDDELTSVIDYAEGTVCVTEKGRQIKAKTAGQKDYVDAIRNNIVTFGIGPAGTGKTFLAVAMAVTAFKNKEVSRIILTRPAVEAGEKLGFLPGDLQNKVDPYLRPLYDALYQMIGADSYLKYLEKGMIEIAPLAYMRGRTLDDAFIILDEAQNTTPEQMKMFLTRIGFGSKAVVTGDVTQIDLPTDKKSGLKEVPKILKDVKDLAFINLTNKDVIRHELVQRIIKAYEKYENSRG